MSVESPEYEVLRREGALELHPYRPYLIASVRVEASGYNEATYAGFGLLADYIFGNNTAAGGIAMIAPVTASHSPGTKIAMTAPVTSERVRNEQLEGAQPLCTVRCADEYEVRFTMPSRFGSIEDLPRPNDSRVRLDAVPEHLAVAARFGGRLARGRPHWRARIEPCRVRESTGVVLQPRTRTVGRGPTRRLPGSRRSAGGSPRGASSCRAPWSTRT